MATAVRTSTMEGLKDGSGAATLDPRVFAVPIDHGLVHEVMVILQGNRRRGTAHTKTRSEVRGGGRKPWRQKGTGRARAGSIRSPIWRGGGVTFGPRNTRNWHRKANREVKNLVLRMALTAKALEGSIHVIQEIPKSTEKTKDAVRFLATVRHKKRSLLVLPSAASRATRRSFRNITGVVLRSPENLSLLEALSSGEVLFTRESLITLTKRLRGDDARDAS